MTPAVAGLATAMLEYILANMTKEKVKNNEICRLAEGKINNAQNILEKGINLSTYSLTVFKDCQERPRENGGPASLPVCRDNCPFYELKKI